MLAQQSSYFPMQFSKAIGPWMHDAHFAAVLLCGTSIVSKVTVCMLVYCLYVFECCVYVVCVCFVYVVCSCLYVVCMLLKI